MSIGKRPYWILGLVTMIVLAFGVVALGPGASEPVPPGHIDDGADLLDQTTISLEEAIAAAQAAYSGALGEVDIEKYEGRLIFNIDIGVKDVKVDAADGTVLGFEEDDHGDNDD